jgi:hypothetical protein
VRFASIFRAPRRARLAPRSESRDAAHWSTSVRAVGPLCPRGPRSGAGYSVPIHPHLFDPIRPTRGHNSISPLSGLYALPLLCVMAPVSVASATHEWFRAFAGRSVSTCRPLGPREIPRRLTPSFFTDDAGLRPKRRVSALPISPTPILMGGFISGLTYGSLSLQPVDLLAPLSEPTRLPPSRRGLVPPGFRRFGHPLRRRISLQRQLGNFLWPVSPLERQLASLQPPHQTQRADFPHWAFLCASCQGLCGSFEQSDLQL